MKGRNTLAALFCLTLALLAGLGLHAQQKDNHFSLSARVKSRGELRAGGFKPDTLDNQRLSHFIIGSYRLTADYQRSWLELRISAQQAGVWGEDSDMLGIYEAYAKLKTKNGWFLKVGRQELNYDDQRIIGNDDWSMTAPTHDVLKLGYEGPSHKLHLLFAYNQNDEDMDNGNSYYSGGIQPHKSMQTFWYHYDTPKSLFGISLLGMNIGMQSKDSATTYYQQLVGTYMTLRPKNWVLEGSFYYQMGKEEHGIPLDAFMGSLRLTVNPKDNYSLYSGYDYLSGDKYFIVPEKGEIGSFNVIKHDKLMGFSSIYGSHHKFYGAMEFFYVNTHVNGFSPGLQNLFVGGIFNPTQKLSIEGAYHYLATATSVKKHKRGLGHEIELTLSYDIAKDINLSAGYSFMYGSKTMEYLQHVNENRRLHWAWLMIAFTPTVFSADF